MTTHKLGLLRIPYLVSQIVPEKVNEFIAGMENPSGPTPGMFGGRPATWAEYVGLHEEFDDIPDGEIATYRLSSDGDLIRLPGDPKPLTG